MADAAEATATSEKLASDVKIEDAGPARKRLTITIPAEAISQKLEDSMDTLAAETAIPGFRKGKAPRQLLQRRFGTAVRDETRNQIIAEAYSQAIEEHEIKPVGDPEPVEKPEDLKIEDGRPLSFSVNVEVVPEFDLPSWEGIEVKKPELRIADEQVASEIERQCRHLGEARRIDGDFSEGDHLFGHATATREGEDEAFFESDDVLIVHPGTKDGGRGQVLGLLIDDVGKRLKGASVGDRITLETVGPEAHEREDIRGRKLRIDFQIRRAERIEPATVEQVVERYGLGTAENLEAQIRLSLENRLREDQARAMRTQAMQHLEQAVDFELPEKLSAAQAERLMKQYEIELLYSGQGREQVEEKLAEARAESSVIAQQRLKRMFLIHRFAEHFEIEVSEQEINGRIAMMASQRGVRPEQLRNELTQSGRISEVAMQIREHKTLDRIVSQARVTEVSAEEWEKLAREQEGEKPAGPAARKTKKKTSTRKKKTT